MKVHFAKRMDRIKLKNLNHNQSTRIKDHQVHLQMKMKTFYKMKLMSSMNILLKRNRNKVSQEVLSKLLHVWLQFIVDFKMVVNFRIVNKKQFSLIFSNLRFLLKVHNKLVD